MAGKKKRTLTGHFIVGASVHTYRCVDSKDRATFDRWLPLDRKFREEHDLDVPQYARKNPEKVAMPRRMRSCLSRLASCADSNGVIDPTSITEPPHLVMGLIRRGMISMMPVRNRPKDRVLVFYPLITERGARAL